MTRILVLAFALPLLAACGDSPTLVVVNRLAQGGGGNAVTDLPQFDIVVRLEADATDFNAPDLMRLLVDGVDRTDEVEVGGLYALLRIDPPPVGTHTVELFRRRGGVLDTFTWDVMPYLGPTLTGVSDDTAMVGTQVTVTGTGFDAAAPRVFFGGIEGTVDASDATTITATVPAGALPGLVWVRIGDDAAEGQVAFQPLDAGGAPVAAPTDYHLVAVFDGNADVEQAVTIWGYAFDEDAIHQIGDRVGARVFGVTTVDFPAIGTLVRAFAVVLPDTDPGATTFFLKDRFDDRRRTNELPFRVD